ncbi:MAG TPA: hypothetical protein VL200_06540 [Lacunisphaera sp.]|jgi:hypothetical protein|nr:hypothetical protein [Lacunisphaera sp.]
MSSLPPDPSGANAPARAVSPISEPSATALRDALRACRRQALFCAEACMALPTAGARELRWIRLLSDCADCCQTCVALLEGSTPTAPAKGAMRTQLLVCVEICQIAIDDYAPQGGPGCDECRAACERCAGLCRQVLALLPADE